MEMSVSLAKYEAHRYPACYATSLKLCSPIDNYNLHNALRQTESPE